MDGADSALTAANLLCQACVDVLEVDGAALSVMHDGTLWGTFGSSDQASRRLDELQFTFGEGPCLDAVRSGEPVSAVDLDGPAEQRWPALRSSLLDSGIEAVFALPVGAASRLGALDLFRRRTGALGREPAAGALLAAELAALPLLNLSPVGGWRAVGQVGNIQEQPAPLERVEVYQATGMLMGALQVDSAEALVRLRAYAFVHSMTASEVAWAIVQRRLALDTDDWLEPGDPAGRTR